MCLRSCLVSISLIIRLRVRQDYSIWSIWIGMQAHWTMLGVTPEQLSELVPTTHRVEGLSAAYASAMGLATDTPFIVGASDGVFANLGVGAFEPGVVAVTIGTSGAVRSVVNEAANRPRRQVVLLCVNRKFLGRWRTDQQRRHRVPLGRDQIATAEAEEARRMGWILMIT